MTRLRLILILSAFGFLGCVSGPYQLERISPGQTVMQAMHDRMPPGKFQAGPQVSASTCETAVFGLIPVTKRATQDTAIRAALESAPGGWSTLLKAEITMTQYPYVLARTICWEAEGQAARRAPRARSASRR